MALTPKQEAFVREWLVDMNAAAAARRAGYSPHTADRMGHELLKKPEISQALAAAMAARAARTDIRADQILSEIDALALSNIADLVDLNTFRLRRGEEIPERIKKCISAVKVRRVVEKNGDGDNVTVEVLEFKLWDKVAALRLALQHRGLLSEKHDHTHRAAPQQFNADEFRKLPRDEQLRLYHEALSAPPPVDG